MVRFIDCVARSFLSNCTEECHANPNVLLPNTVVTGIAPSPNATWISDDQKLDRNVSMSM
ncbi:MAG: hypothetical protein ABGZ35_08125 [Planctomycetaceae bacterium]